MIHKVVEWLKEIVEETPLKNVETVIKRNPKKTIAIVGTALTFLLARRLHHHLVVYPEIGGRYNHLNIAPLQHPRNRGLTASDITLPSPGKVQLRGWYITQPNSKNLTQEVPLSQTDIGGRIPFIEEVLDKTNCNVLIVAYRGFSDSDGKSKPNEAELITDAKTILDEASHMAERQKLSLYVYGRSLGGATSLGALAQKQYPLVKGLILQNTFTSIYDVATNIPLLGHLRPLVWLITAGSFNSAARIKKVKVPILFIKGCRDKLVPKRLMDRLEEICVKHKMERYSLEVQNGTHNDTWVRAGDIYFQTINQFMMQCARL